jgi:hypothetical protein
VIIFEEINITSIKNESIYKHPDTNLTRMVEGKEIRSNHHTHCRSTYQ